MAGSNRTEPYQLDELSKLASELGSEWSRVNENRVDVTLRPGMVLAFLNHPEEGDTLVGFEGTGWHAHGTVVFVTGENTGVACNELDILIGLACGELLVVSRYTGDKLQDRWLAHRGDPDLTQHVWPGDELRIYRCSEANETSPSSTA
jgi:hypothetical protein